MVLCIAAVGRPLPSTLIWKQKIIPDEFEVLPAYDIPIVINESGWETKATFETIMLNIYIPQLIERREQLQKKKDILLILDGHGSRMSLAVLLCCMRWRITIVVIPAHTSSEVQTLDLGVNGAFKSSFAKEAAVRINGTPGAFTPACNLSSFSSSCMTIDGCSNQSHNSTPTVQGESQTFTDDSSSMFVGLHRNMHITGSQLPAINSVDDDIPLPSLPQDLVFHTIGQQPSAPEQRRLLAEVIPKSLEKALSISVISAAWTKSGIFPFNPSIVLNRLPEGERILQYSTAKPVISGRILTSREMFLEILDWEVQKQLRSLKQQKSEKESALLIIGTILEDVYTKIADAESRYMPGQLLSPPPLKKSEEEIQLIYTEIEQLKRKRSMETITDKPNYDEITTHTDQSSVTSPLHPSQLVSLAELQRIREMSDDMFKDYCSSFGKKQITQTIKTISAVHKKTAHVEQRSSEELDALANNEEMMNVEDTCTDSEMYSMHDVNSESSKVPVRRTRSLRVQRRFEDCLDSEEMDDL